MKVTVTVGMIEGHPVILKSPSIDPNPHIEFIKQLTNEGGKINDGKKKISVDEAIVLHSSRGAIKSRRFR